MIWGQNDFLSRTESGLFCWKDKALSNQNTLVHCSCTSWLKPLSITNTPSTTTFSIHQHTEPFLHVKWDIKPKMWVMSFKDYCPWLWHVILEPVQPLVFPRLCHLYRPLYTSHPCNYFTWSPSPPPPLWHPGLLLQHTGQSCQQFPLTEAL